MDAHKQRLGVLDGPWRSIVQLWCFQKTFCCVDGVVASLHGSADQSRGMSRSGAWAATGSDLFTFSGTYGATP